MRALILGVWVQDGSYLAKFILEKGYPSLSFVKTLSKSTAKHAPHLVHRSLGINGSDWWSFNLKFQKI